MKPVSFTAGKHTNFFALVGSAEIEARYICAAVELLAAGLIYRFANNVMATVQGGFGRSAVSPDIFGSGGIGFMFP